MVSHTQTCIGGFEGFGVAGSTGVIPSCSLNWFDANPGAPNSLEPGKRPLTNMTPMIVERDGKPVLAVGAPGRAPDHQCRQSGGPECARIRDEAAGGGLGRHASTTRRRDSAPTTASIPRCSVNLERRGHDVERVHEFISYGGAGAGFPGFTGHFARPNAIFIDEDGARHGGDYPGAFGAVIGVE